MLELMRLVVSVMIKLPLLAELVNWNECSIIGRIAKNFFVSVRSFVVVGCS